MHIVSLADIEEAQTRLHGVTVRTRLIEFPHADATRRLFLKPENQQPIGAFKLRGAYNKIASLSEDDRKRGVISYSSGNHAQGVAYAARALDVKAVIVMPNNAPAIKREATAALGAEIVLVGPGSTERQLKAEELAAQHGYVIVPPYNDEKIIAGQGTIGLEILEDLPEVEAVFAPVGGGGTRRPARLRNRASLERRKDHRRSRHHRPRDPRRPAGSRSRLCSSWRRRIDQRRRCRDQIGRASCRERG